MTDTSGPTTITVSYKGQDTVVDTSGLDGYVYKRALELGLEIMADKGEYIPNKPTTEAAYAWAKARLAEYVQDDSWQDQANARYAAACMTEITSREWLVVNTKNGKYWKIILS
jgi:hypothetical protein